jgi:hypothetical protein
MTAITAVCSILYVRRVTTPPCAIDHPLKDGKQIGDDGQPIKPEPGPRKWTAGTVLLVIALLLLHFDLLVTGHLRAGVKGLIAQFAAGR